MLSQQMRSDVIRKHRLSATGSCEFQDAVIAANAITDLTMRWRSVVTDPIAVDRDATLALIQVEQLRPVAGGVERRVDQRIAEVFHRITEVGPLPVDQRAHLVAVEHEVRRTRVTVHERDAVDRVRDVPAQPLNSKRGERLDEEPAVRLLDDI